MKRVIICGKAGSGKDYLRKKWQTRGFHYTPSYTTRPLRPGEVNGVEYFFVNEQEFQEKKAQGWFYETVVFNQWYYGTSNEQFYQTSDLLIMTPSGVKQLKEQDRKLSFIIYLDIPLEVRKQRLLTRQDVADKVERRIQADEQDFANFQDYDLHITNANF